MSNRSYRRIPHTKPWCCYSRLGKAKAAYDSREEALKACRSAERQYRDGRMEPYECQVHPGKFHIRKTRREEVLT